MDKYYGKLNMNESMNGWMNKGMIVTRYICIIKRSVKNTSDAQKEFDKLYLIKISNFKGSF